MRQREAGRAKDTISEQDAFDGDLARNVGFLIRKMYQKNQAIWQELCTDPQLTSPQFSVLGILSRSGSSSLSGIGKNAAMDPATTRGVVDRLQLRGLVALENDARDRRKVIVRLEPSGMAIVAAMESVMPRVTDMTLQPLNPAERVALQYLLVKATRKHES